MPEDKRLQRQALDVVLSVVVLVCIFGCFFWVGWAVPAVAIMIYLARPWDYRSRRDGGDTKRGRKG